MPVRDSLADGLAGNLEAGSLTFSLTQRYVDRGRTFRNIRLVEEAEIARAIRTLIEREHILVEGSVAVGLAALQSGRLSRPNGPVVLIVTGRNVAPGVLDQVLAPSDGTSHEL